MKLFLVDKKVMVGHAFNTIDAFKWVVHNHSSSLFFSPDALDKNDLKRQFIKHSTINSVSCFLFGATLTTDRDGDNATKACDSW